MEKDVLNVFVNCHDWNFKSNQLFVYYFTEDEGRSSHLLFTIHVYQYRIEKENKAGLPGGNV